MKSFQELTLTEDSACPKSFRNSEFRGFSRTNVGWIPIALRSYVKMEASNEEHFENILLPVMLLCRRRLRRSARLNIRGSIFREGGVY